MIMSLFFKDKGYKQNIYLSHNNRVISKWYKKDFLENIILMMDFQYNNKLLKKMVLETTFIICI